MKLSTSVFSDILSDYEKRRRDNILSAMDLRDRLYEKYPEFRQIDDEFADLSFEEIQALTPMRLHTLKSMTSS